MRQANRMLHLITRDASGHSGSAAQNQWAAGKFVPPPKEAGDSPARCVRGRFRGCGMVASLLVALFPALFLLPLFMAHLHAQDLPGRYRRFSSNPRMAPRPALPEAAAGRVPQTPPAAPPAKMPAAAVVPLPTAAVGASGALPPSLLDQPAQPPQIELLGKMLSIRADNSSLGAILREIASKSGMQLQGFQADERVFGSFGPGAPRAVISDLLNGTPYDLVMVGDLSNGVPRQLILSPATAGGPTPPSAQGTTEDAEQDAPPPPAPPEPGPRGQMAPGANPQRVRTPQELLKELQQMRQQQGQQ